MSTSAGRARRIGAVVVAIVVTIAGGFYATAVWPGWRTPEVRTTDAAPGRPRETLTLLAWNIARCEAYDGSGLRPTAEVARCLDEVAGVIRETGADLVFLSEIVRELGPSGLDQVDRLARASGLHASAFGENFAWGWPYLRVRAGNAILSRFPLEPVDTLELASDAPWWDPTNRRRLPFVSLVLGPRRVLLGSVRNDSFSLHNNYVHARQILRWLGGRPAVLAGDFNAEIQDASMQAFEESGQFTAEWYGPPTFPSEAPSRGIDFILAPLDWTLVSHEVLDRPYSDHRPVVSRFRLPAELVRGSTLAAGAEAVGTATASAP